MKKAILITSASIYILLWAISIFKIDLKFSNDVNNFFRLMYIIGFLLSFVLCTLIFFSNHKHSLGFKLASFLLVVAYVITYLIVFLNGLNHR